MKAGFESCKRDDAFYLTSASDMARLLPKLKQWRLTFAVSGKHMSNFEVSCLI
jgi:hypothetical protein